VVATFARMHPQKRPFDVIRLARRMANRNLHFLLVGGGPLDHAVDRELARRPLYNLTRLPFRHDTDELFEAVDICLLVSEYEGLPVFLLEGMARSLPCVATAVGDIPTCCRRAAGWWRARQATSPGSSAPSSRWSTTGAAPTKGRARAPAWSRTSASTATSGSTRLPCSRGDRSLSGRLSSGIRAHRLGYSQRPVS